ncbi:MAG: alpha/beta hydrolase [Bacteroidia bacterium]
MKPNRIVMVIVSLWIFVSSSCSKEEFQISQSANDTFHVKNGDFLIPVWIRGNTASKKIILYVQGGPAGNTMDFATIDYPGWKNTLEKDYAIAYYEQRGTGNQQGNFSLGDSILVTYVQDIHVVAAFLEKAYDAEIILMGHSFGGGLTLRYMVEYGRTGIPKKYISLNGPVTTDINGEQLRWQFRREFLLNSANLEISRGNNVSRWNEVLQWLEETPVIEKLPGANPYQLMNQWNAYVEELIYSYYGEKTIKFSEYLKIFSSPYNPFPAYLRHDYKEGGLGTRILAEEEAYQLINQLPTIDHQALLLVTGRFDDICVPEELTYTFNQITSPLKQIQIIDKAGHEIFTHQPEELYNLINQFIQ